MLSGKFDYLHFWFALILLINCVIRFWGLSDFSLSNDELSSVVRSSYDTLSELINFGVLETDPHPAGVQIFLFFWVKVFGNSAIAVRFPFVVAGLVSLVFLYNTFAQWFGRQNSLLAITFFSLLQFTLIHSQLSRPYAIGLMFTSIFIWSWSRIVFKYGNFRVSAITYIISGTICWYTHYFAGLTASFLGIAGIYMVARGRGLLSYLLINVVIVLLFFPHLKVTFHQILGSETIQWVPPVEWSFVSNHFAVLFNHSTWITALFLIMFLFSAVRIFIKDRSQTSKWWLSMLFYVLPFAFGYAYSRLCSPILLDRVLIFSTPFLFAVATGLLPRLNKLWLNVVLGFTVLALVSSLYFETSFKDRQYTENFKGIAEEIRLYHEPIIKGEMLGYGNFNSEKYIEYYLEDESPLVNIDRPESDSILASYYSEISHSHARGIVLVWACRYQPPELLEYALQFFPNVRKNIKYYNSGLWILEKGQATRDTLIFENLETFEGIEFDSLSASLLLPEKREFVNLMEFELGNPFLETINVKFNFSDGNSKGWLLVSEIRNESGKSVFWMGRKLQDFEIVNGWNEFFATLDLSKGKGKGKLALFYLWNSEGHDLYIRDINLSSFSRPEFRN